MKKLKKVVTAALAAALVVGAAGVVYADGEISVRMNGVAANSSEYISFSRMNPIQVDNRTLTPARDMAEAAGMTVDWDQPTQTAILTLRADGYSKKPVERYAAQAINHIHDYGLELEPVSITAALKLNSDTAVIRYNFVDSEGDTVPIGTRYKMVSKAIFIEDGTLMIPIRDSMEMFGLTVGWNQEELCASVSIPDEVSIPDGLAIIANHGEGEYAPITSTDVKPTDPVDTNPALGAYIGRFKITHYCTCSICNGGWGAHTAWAGDVIPGQTIAVNPNIIPPLSWVYIEGYGLRRAEDTGGGIAEYQIDIAVENHETAMRLGVVYKDVYFAE